MGYAKLAVLKSSAVPTMVPTPLPQPTLSGQLHLLPSARLHLEVDILDVIILALLDVRLVIHYIILSSNFRFRAEVLLYCCLLLSSSLLCISNLGEEKKVYIWSVLNIVSLLNWVDCRL